MKTRLLGNCQVSEIGLGCMSMSHAYGVPPPAEVSERVLKEALDRGVTLFDTAALYGFGANERLVGRVLRPFRANALLATKGGMAGVDTPGGKKRVIDGRPEAIRRDCEGSLERLGNEVLDLYYLHRVDLGNEVPVEDSVGEMSRLVEEGKVRSVGLSEVSHETLRRAHRVHPIAAVQSEYSLWTRNPELGVLGACSELGIAFVAFSPLGRGFLSGALTDPSTLHELDLRRRMPRFGPDNFSENLRLLDGLFRVAEGAGGSPAQVALAWLLQRAPFIIPIPGTTRVSHLAENVGAAEVSLSVAAVAQLNACINQQTVVGARYGQATQAELDSEEFESLARKAKAHQ